MLLRSLFFVFLLATAKAKVQDQGKEDAATTAATATTIAAATATTPQHNC